MKTSGKVLAEQVARIKQSERFSIRSENLPTWCPGCGDMGLLNAFKKAVTALVEEGFVKKENIAVSSGIGSNPVQLVMVIANRTSDIMIPTNGENALFISTFKKRLR